MFGSQLEEIELSEPVVLGGESEDQIAYEATIEALRRDDTDTGRSRNRRVLPDGLELVPPGVFLAAVVSSVDRTRLNGYDLVRLLQAEARLEAWAGAEKVSSVAEIAHCPPSNPDSPVERSPYEVDYAAAEVAAGLTLTRRSSEKLLDRSLWLTGPGIRVLQAVAAGRISLRKADVFHQHLSHLPTETVEAILDEVLDAASELTVGQLSYRVSKQVMVQDPDGAKSSFQQGLQERRLVSHANPDFTGCLHLCSAHPADIAAARHHIETIARRLKAAGGETRTLDQLRADITVDLLKGQNPDAEPSETTSNGSVHLTVPLATLTRLSDLPGDLNGYAPVIADIARQIALKQTDGAWTWTISNDGNIIATGTTRYRPRQAQKRRSRADYQQCVAPGCRMPAHQCDLDHTRPASQGGATHNDNLAPLCRYHHMMKHHTTWKYRRLPNGDHEWTSPLEHKYIRPRDPPEEA